MTVAIRERGIDEIYAEFEGTLQGPHRFLVAAPLPLLAAADAPSAISKLADFRFCGTQLPIVHLLVLA